MSSALLFSRDLWSACRMNSFSATRSRQLLALLRYGGAINDRPGYYGLYICVPAVLHSLRELGCVTFMLLPERMGVVVEPCFKCCCAVSVVRSFMFAGV